jgi:hypothetical protein
MGDDHVSDPRPTFHGQSPAEDVWLAASDRYYGQPAWRNELGSKVCTKVEWQSDNQDRR